MSSTEREERSVTLAADCHDEVEDIDTVQGTTVPEIKPQKSRKAERDLQWFTVLRIALVLVVSVPLTLPIILFYLPQQDVEEDCPCSPKQYNGTICLTELQYVQNYSSWTQNNSNIFISAEREQEVLETIAQCTFTELQLLGAKEECMNVFKPFMCLLLFGLCDGSGQGILPSYEECVAIRSEYCAEEVQLAMNRSDTTEPFPNYISLILGNSCASYSNEKIPENQSTTCSDGFYFDENSLICVPECGVWTVHSATADNAITGVLIAGIALGMIVNATVLLITIIQHKRMLKFPSTFIFYHCVSLLVYSSVDFIGRVRKEELVCSSKNLLEALNNTTSFYCKLVGGLFVYTALQVALWWLFQVTIIFWGITRPLKYRQMCESGKLKYIHLTMVIAGFVLPLIPTLICNWIGGFGILLQSHYSCHPHGYLAYRYSFYIPLNILLIIGIGLLVTIFSTIGFEKRGNLSKGERRAVMKILIIICFFFIFTLYIMTSVAISEWKEEEFINDLSTYFACESRGAQECSKDKFKVEFTIFNVIPYIVYVNTTSIYFIYVIDINACKKVFNRTLTFSTI